MTIVADLLKIMEGMENPKDRLSMQKYIDENFLSKKSKNQEKSKLLKLPKKKTTTKQQLSQAAHKVTKSLREQKKVEDEESKIEIEMEDIRRKLKKLKARAQQLTDTKEKLNTQKAACIHELARHRAFLVKMHDNFFPLTIGDVIKDAQRHSTNGGAAIRFRRVVSDLQAMHATFPTKFSSDEVTTIHTLIALANIKTKPKPKPIKRSRESPPKNKTAKTAKTVVMTVDAPTQLDKAPTAPKKRTKKDVPPVQVTLAPPGTKPTPGVTVTLASSPSSN